MTTDLIAKLDAPGREMPNPTEADLTDPVFEAIWQTIKTWDVNAPEYYVGYCGANGSHVKLILNALSPIRAELLAARELISLLHKAGDACEPRFSVVFKELSLAARTGELK